MTVTPESAAASVEVEGETIYFCAVGCKEKYLQKESEIEGQGMRGEGAKSEAPVAIGISREAAPIEETLWIRCAKCLSSLPRRR